MIDKSWIRMYIQKINIQRFIYCIYIYILSGTGFDRDTVSHNDMTTFNDYASVPN